VNRYHTSLLFAAALFAGAVAAAGDVIDAMERAPLPTVGDGGQTSALVDGFEGKAVRLSFPDGAKSKYFRTRVRGAASWDAAAGFSFRVKGDGSKGMGCLQFIWNEDYAARYDVAFPLASTEWTKVVVAWDDLVPVLPKPSCRFVGTGPGRNAPSKMSQMWIGKWWYWHDVEAHTFAIDHFALERTIERDETEYRPRGAPLARTLQKLKAGKPVSVATMGDSLTDFRHWANRGVNWPTLFKESLSTTYRSNVTLVNPAIGGTQLRQNLILVTTWLDSAAPPDLITICFGYNDWEAGMRADMFRETYEYAVRRLRRLTRGRSDILVITTCPAVAKWDTMAELAEACRAVARSENAGLADTYAAFHREGATDREHLYCRDKTHLGPAGHRVFARTVVDALERGGR